MKQRTMKQMTYSNPHAVSAEKTFGFHNYNVNVMKTQHKCTAQEQERVQNETQVRFNSKYPVLLQKNRVRPGVYQGKKGIPLITDDQNRSLGKYRFRETGTGNRRRGREGTHSKTGCRGGEETNL